MTFDDYCSTIIFFSTFVNCNDGQPICGPMRDGQPICSQYELLTHSTSPNVYLSIFYTHDLLPNILYFTIYTSLLNTSGRGLKKKKKNSYVYSSYQQSLLITESCKFIKCGKTNTKIFPIVVESAQNLAAPLFNNYKMSQTNTTKRVKIMHKGKI